MRKLILSAAIVLLSSSAFAQGPRGLSSPQPTVAQPAVVQAAEQRPARRPEITFLPAPAEQPAVTSAPQSLEDKLKAAGELKPDGTPAYSTPAPAPVQAQAPVQAPAPVQVEAPVQAQASVQPQPAPAPAAVHATAPAAAKPVVQAHSTHKPAKKRVAHRGESDERKARRIAARFGISW
jgi:hypothetical protein